MRAPKQPKSLPKPLTAADAKRVVALGEQLNEEPWIASRNAAVLTLLYGCGLRISEALGLTGAQFAHGETTLRVAVTDRVSPGVVYTTFHHPVTQANVVTTDFSDWATNCPEYKVTAVQVSPSNGPSDWQERYGMQADMSRRVMPAAE